MRRLAILCAAWTAVGLAGVLSQYVRIRAGEDAAPGWWWLSLVATPVWIALTPGVWRLSRVPWPRAIVAHAIGLAIVLAVDGAAVTLLDAWRGIDGGTFGQHVWRWSFVNAAFYAGVVAVEHAARYHAISVRTAALEAQLARAQLQALQMQIRPHFLFNTLNAIAGLVRTNERAAAIEMLAGLGDLLRALTRSDGAQEVPLAQELELIGRYIDIERVRFGDALSIEVVVGEAAGRALVPNLLLQPLVENAIRHGIGTAGRIAIRAECDAGTLRIAVSNSGDARYAPGNGIGLANTRARLAGLYGDAHRFELVHSAAGTSAVVEIPLREVA
ncbi:MAG TPA: histidine kinase [Kofleriaceae bacterium]